MIDDDISDICNIATAIKYFFRRDEYEVQPRNHKSPL